MGAEKASGDEKVRARRGQNRLTASHGVSNASQPRVAAAVPREGRGGVVRGEEIESEEVRHCASAGSPQHLFQQSFRGRIQRTISIPMVSNVDDDLNNAS